MNEEDVVRYRLMGFKWVDIARFFEVDRSTLYRFRQQCGLIQVGNFLNDDELDGMIEEISTAMPNTGIKSLENIIKAKNFTVPRQQLRDSVHRVDPEGVARRRLGKLERRVYNV